MTWGYDLTLDPFSGSGYLIVVVRFSESIDNPSFWRSPMSLHAVSIGGIVVKKTFTTMNEKSGVWYTVGLWDIHRFKLMW